MQSVVNVDRTLQMPVFVWGPRGVFSGNLHSLAVLFFAGTAVFVSLVQSSLRTPEVPGASLAHTGLHEFEVQQV